MIIKFDIHPNMLHADNPIIQDELFFQFVGKDKNSIVNKQMFAVTAQEGQLADKNLNAQFGGKEHQQIHLDNLRAIFKIFIDDSLLRIEDMVKTKTMYIRNINYEEKEFKFDTWWIE